LHGAITTSARISFAAIDITREERYVWIFGSTFFTSIAPQQFQFLTSSSASPSALPTALVDRL
jgi:hypothetical protein